MSTYRTYDSPYFEARALAMSGVLKVRWDDRLSVTPNIIPETIELADKVEGMLLGLAIGDSLGNTSESMLPSSRQEVHGLIDDYLPNLYANDRRIGLPSDDTQMAFWTLEHLVSEGHLQPQYLGAAFTHKRIYGVGKSVREFLKKFKSGTPWTHSGAESAGNGALMRIAPILLPYLKKPNCDLWCDTLMAGHLTHNDELSNVSCVAFIDLLWKLISYEGVPETSWWVETFVATCESVEADRHYQPRGGHPPDFSGKLSQLLRSYVVPALEADLSVTDACSIWHSGAYLLETVPSVIYILARHGHDPRAAILAAVNETKDNDTIGAIVGAAIGALHGRSKIPAEWVTGLLGRTEADNDGRIFELIADAGRTFGYGVSDSILNRVPVKSPKPNERTRERGTSVSIFSKTYWVKIVAFLQQNWAAIDDLPGSAGVRIWFFDDSGGVFDCIDYSSRVDARQALRVNGFSVFSEDKFDFLAKPGPEFKLTCHPNGNGIYSSGRYWIGQTGN